jgi:hypothetical protein
MKDGIPRTPVNRLRGLPPGPTAIIRLVGGPLDGEAWRVPCGTTEIAPGDDDAADPELCALYRRRRRSSRRFDFVAMTRIPRG